MVTQKKYNWHGLEDSSYNYPGENQERYSIPDEAFYLWNSLASGVDQKSGGKQQISIRMQKVVERKKQPLPSVSPRSTAPRVLPEYPRLDRALRALQGNYLTSAKLLRRAIHPAPELSPPIGHPNDSLSHNIYFWLNAPTNYFTDTTIPKLPPSSISFPPTKTRDRQGHPRLPPSLLTRLLALNLLLPRLILTHAHRAMNLRKRSKGTAGGAGPFFAIS